MRDSLIPEAEQAELEAQMARWPGQVAIGEEVYDCALIIGRGASLMDDNGIYATEAITTIIPRNQIAEAPAPGKMLENVETGRRYELISTRRNTAAWIFRGGIFPR